MYSTLAEGGQTPVVISEGGRDKGDFGGGGVLIILLFVIVIAIVLIPLISRREPVVERGGALAEILPAMMVMQSASQRQTVDVNSHNTDGSGRGPSNFQIYQQGVATNDNVFTQSCNTRELVRNEGNETRTLILTNQLREVERELDRERAERLADRTNFAIERSNNEQSNRLESFYGSIHRRLTDIEHSMPLRPIPAYNVSPYGEYQPGFARVLRDDRDCCH